MSPLQKLKEAKMTLEQVKQCGDFHCFKKDFHSCCESLASIFQIADEKLKSFLRGKFFPEVIKTIRDQRFHRGVDAFDSGATHIPGITSSGGPVRINNSGTMILNGIVLPKGSLSFGAKTPEGFSNTINGLGSEALDEIPTVVEIKMRDLFSSEITEKLKNSGVKDEDLEHWQNRIDAYAPVKFLEDAIKFYEAMLNG